MAPTASPLVTLAPGTVLHDAETYVAVSLGSVFLDGEAYDVSVQTYKRSVGAHADSTVWLHRGSDCHPFILRPEGRPALFHALDARSGRPLVANGEVMVVCHVGDIVEQVL